MTLKIQKYLRAGNSLQNLREEHGIKNNILNKKISLTYDQIAAKESNPIANECRGLVLRENTYDIVAIPFFRFFNYGTSQAANIDWNTAKFFNKIDGTLIITYWDDHANKWHCATRSMPEAHGTVNNANMTFAQLVDRTVLDNYDKNNLHDFMEFHCKNDKHLTFCFELTTPYNRVCVKYDDLRLHLLGVRCKNTFKEFEPKDFSHIPVEMPEVYDFNMSTIFDIISDWNPSEKEGIVIRDSNFNRIKVKTPAYVALARMSESLGTSWRACAELILLGKDDDIIPQVDSFIVERIKKLKPAIKKLIIDTERAYENFKNIENQKEFALAIKNVSWKAVLFAIRNNKCSSVEDFITKSKTNGSIKKTLLDNILSMCQEIDPNLIKTL